MKPTMTIKAACSGDPSVGISGCQIECGIAQEDFEGDDQYNNEFRNDLRRLFRTFAGTLFDEAAVVWYSDECPDCQKIRDGVHCENTNCISYQPPNERSIENPIKSFPDKIEANPSSIAYELNGAHNRVSVALPPKILKEIERRYNLDN